MDIVHAIRKSVYVKIKSGTTPKLMLLICTGLCLADELEPCTSMADSLIILCLEPGTSMVESLTILCLGTGELRPSRKPTLFSRACYNKMIPKPSLVITVFLEALLITQTPYPFF